MAQLYCPGSAFVYCGVDTSTHGDGALFFGVSREPLEIHVVPYYRKLPTDDSGDGADDVQAAGEEAYIFGEFNWYSEKTYRLLQARPDPKGVRGTWKQRDMGRLLGRGRCMYQVWIQFPYAAKLLMGGTPNVNGAIPAPSITPAAIAAAFAGVGGAALGLTTTFSGNVGTGQELSPMPAGYRFAACYLPQDQMKGLGTTARRNSLMWHAIMSPTRNGSGKNVRVLYDHDMAGLSGKSPK